MILLSGGGMATTVFAWRLATLVAERSKGNPWALAYALYGALVLIGLVLISLGWTLGKSAMKGTLPGGATFDVTGGEDDGSAPAAIVTTTTSIAGGGQ